MHTITETADDVFAYIVNEFTNFERTPGDSMRPYRQDRMRALLAHYGNPQDSFKSIHVAGSKGKGSTAAFMHYALSMSGRVTGLYTSPHVSDFRERITINMLPVPDELIVKNGQMLRSDIEERRIPALPARDQPTTFELLTLLAYLCFRDAACEWAVIEVGIGGRLDTTNILSPVATVITPIELEHTDLLGPDLASIAREKAGIIKDGIPVFVAAQEPEAFDVIASVAVQKHAALHSLSSYFKRREYVDGALRLLIAETVVFDGHLGMEGPYQGDNAALAYATLNSLKDSHQACMDAISNAETAFLATSLPGRFERIPGDRVVILDAAHTPSSVTKVMNTFVDRFGSGGILIFGSVTGKNSASMAAILAPVFSNVIISRPGTFKKSDPEQVFREFSQLHRNVELVLEPERAVRTALAMDPMLPILVCGSFYLIGEVRAALTQI